MEEVEVGDMDNRTLMQNSRVVDTIKAREIHTLSRLPIRTPSSNHPRRNRRTELHSSKEGDMTTDMVHSNRLA